MVEASPSKRAQEGLIEATGRQAAARRDKVPEVAAENLAPDPVELDRFAEALVRLLADWWRRQADVPSDDRQP